jgi:fumarate reductase flavoprotein subunit
MIMTAFEAADNDIPYGLVASAEVMVVDQTGTRFINEANIAMNAYTNGAKYYTILSAEQIEILKTQGLSKNSSGRYLSQGGVKADTPLTNIDAVIEKGIEMGFIYKADSLDALVSAIGNEKMSADNLKASVAAYNVAANGGEDALGKTADNFARLGAVNEGSKYYVAITGAPYIYSTCGGLEVNVDMQVINEAGEVIEGLYAVGTDSMGVMFTNTKGYTNYGGVAQGFAFWSGRVAGAHAAGNK